MPLQPGTLCVRKDGPQGVTDHCWVSLKVHSRVSLLPASLFFPPLSPKLQILTSPQMFPSRVASNG